MIQAKAGVLAGLIPTIPTWVTSISYKVGNTAIRVNTLYFCMANHTSGTFYVDWLTNGYWIALGDAPGRICETAGSTAEPGFLLCDRKTLGDDSSGADYAGDEYRELYERINNIWGGTYDWSNHNVVYLPDKRGVYTKGAGTTDRALGKDANGNYYSGVLGYYLQDKMQGHRHAVLRFSAFQYGYPASPSTLWLGSEAVDSGDPKTDGTNGTPRTGLTTEPQSLAVTFMIKY